MKSGGGLYHAGELYSRSKTEFCMASREDFPNCYHRNEKIFQLKNETRGHIAAKIERDYGIDGSMRKILMHVESFI